MGTLSGIWDAIRDFFTGGPAGGDSNYTGPIHRLYVGNLSYKVKEEELRALFSKHGKVKALHLIRDRLTRRLKGYAFIEMAPEDAAKALVLNGADFLGRKLIVSAAKTRAPKAERSSRRRPSSSSSSSTPMKWRRRRSGPRVYGGGGPQKPGSADGTPIQRYE